MITGGNVTVAGKFINFRDADGTSCYLFETRPEYAEPGRTR
jgi:hypothetical protein